MDTIGIFTCELYIKSGGNITPPAGRSVIRYIFSLFARER